MPIGTTRLRDSLTIAEARRVALAAQGFSRAQIEALALLGA